jgi:hypothetical protein
MAKYFPNCRAAKSHGLPVSLQVFALTSRLVLKISRILTKIQLAKILSVLSKEKPYVFVKWEIKKPKSPQFVVEIKVGVQYSRKNCLVLPNFCGTFVENFVASPLVLVSLRIYTKNTPRKAKCVLVKIPYFNACLKLKYFHSLHPTYTP